ncbi:MAG: Pivalyl-CoA mutase small subunit [Gemmatimonadaceae bacterium]|nr:Pivalyl-CoA mutase small subunit [Gemmatimonadaceae bacterium]
MSSPSSRPPRVLIAKPGLDGHDVGARIVCRALMDAGMEVIYTGLRASPRSVAAAALQEDVDVVGLSVLSGAHMPLARKVVDELRDAGALAIPVIVGGTVPASDVDALKALGVAAVFPTGSRLEDIVAFVRRQVTA